MITAIVLAAGESRRMGTPKALLKIGAKSFICHIIDILKTSHVEKTVVVLGAFAETIRKELEGTCVTVVFNKNYQRGQLSSILSGIEIVETFFSDGALIHPVDHPLISAELVNSLITKFDKNRPLIVVPTYNGKRGHPVVFSSQLFTALKNTLPSVGARAVVWQHRDETLEVETEERGCILDIDSRRDYEVIESIIENSTQHHS